MEESTELEEHHGVRGRTTRSKSKSKRLSTIINSLHVLSSTTKTSPQPSESRWGGSDSSSQHQSNISLTGHEDLPETDELEAVTIKEEPLSDNSRANEDISDVMKRKRGRPKKDSLLKIPSSERGIKRKQVRYKDHPCEVCGKRFDSYYLKIHMRRHTGEKPYACSECNKKFRKKPLLKAHLKRYHGDLKDLMCDLCGNVFSSKGNLKSHKLIHTDEKRFECKVCRKRFRQAVHLTEHEKTHENEFPYRCLPCGKQYKCKLSLDKHKESYHDGIKRVFPCHLCDKSFTRKAKLNDHVNFHLGQSRHLCEYCGKPFLSRKTLRTHILIHEDKKPYLCQVCGRAFRQSNVLKLHMSTHTGIKPFKCNACGKQFIHRVYMVRHPCPSKTTESKSVLSQDTSRHGNSDIGQRSDGSFLRPAEGDSY